MLNRKILRTEIMVLHISALQIILYSHHFQGFLITLTFGLNTVKSKAPGPPPFIGKGFLSLKSRSLFSSDLAVDSAIWNCDGGCITLTFTVRTAQHKSPEEFTGALPHGGHQKNVLNLA